MKRGLLISFLCLLLAGNAGAQKGLDIGLDGAANLIFVINQNNYGRTELEYAPTSGFAGGISVGYNFDKHFGIQIEGWHVMEGQHYKLSTISGVDITRKLDLMYNQIPLLFKYSGGGDFGTRFYFMFGPQLGFLQSAHETIQGSGPDNENRLDITSRFQKTDVGLVLDLGSDFNITHRIYMSAGLRFNYGLNDINAPAWRIRNHDGNYGPSQNAYGGVHIGLHYMIIRQESVTPQYKGQP